ncbi:putative abortive infection phage resistance protein [Geomonas sp. Red276]
MSIIHVNQIKSQVIKLFGEIVDLSDLINPAESSKEDFLLTRSLAAYAIHYLSEATPEDAASSVTDAANDNGLDAIYFDEPNKRLYLVQSKWIKNGIGEPENGDIKKFVAGVRDLFNLRFDRFNKKIQKNEALVSAALNDPLTRYEIVVVHTGASKLAEPSARDLEDLAAEFNDVSEVLYTTVLNQAELHKSLTASVAGEPISLQIGLKSWGRKDAPHEAFYGQVSADQVASWWTQYRHRLFARNLRGTLGETDVNVEMRQTLEKTPTDFWYFNNGITLVARSAKRTMAGGAGTDFSTFHCEDISVVNGAQTVSSIGKYGDANPAKLEDVSVHLRIIVRGENQSFADDVTRTNNRQNRIENRDFVTIDPEQSRIRVELAIDGIDYQMMRSDSVVRSDTAFDLVEATTALACASGTIRLPVQLKREIGKLWDDIKKAPYKELFNPSIPGLFVWRCVKMQRRIDKAIESYCKRTETSNNYGLTTHGNRLIAALVFEALPVNNFKTPGFEPDSATSEENLTALVDRRVEVLSTLLELHYPNSIIPTLFKNLKKCEHLGNEARSILNSEQAPAA